MARPMDLHNQLQSMQVSGSCSEVFQANGGCMGRGGGSTKSDAIGAIFMVSLATGS